MFQTGGEIANGEDWEWSKTGLIRTTTRSGTGSEPALGEDGIRFWIQNPGSLYNPNWRRCGRRQKSKGTNGVVSDGQNDVVSK